MGFCCNCWSLLEFIHSLINSKLTPTAAAALREGDELVWTNLLKRQAVSVRLFLYTCTKIAYPPFTFALYLQSPGLLGPVLRMCCRVNLHSFQLCWLPTRLSSAVPISSSAQPCYYPDCTPPAHSLALHLNKRGEKLKAGIEWFWPGHTYCAYTQLCTHKYISTNKFRHTRICLKNPSSVGPPATSADSFFKLARRGGS